MRRIVTAGVVGAAVGIAASLVFTSFGQTGGAVTLNNLVNLKGYAVDAEDDVRRIFLGALLYTAFEIYWSLMARNAAPTERSESHWSSLLHQILYNGTFILLILPIPGLTRRFLPTTFLLVAFGLVLQVGCTLLAVWARWHLGRNWSGAVRIAVDHQLVRTGPYRLLRHPIYTSVLGMVLAMAIACGQIHALLAVPLIIAAYGRKIPMEERILQETFGAEYESYRHGTWALIPFLF